MSRRLSAPGRRLPSRSTIVRGGTGGAGPSLLLRCRRPSRTGRNQRPQALATLQRPTHRRKGGGILGITIHHTTQ
jgi:hypothetical protein